MSDKQDPSGVPIQPPPPPPPPAKDEPDTTRKPSHDRPSRRPERWPVRDDRRGMIVDAAIGGTYISGPARMPTMLTIK